jgi:hypothetical protein
MKDLWSAQSSNCDVRLHLIPESGNGSQLHYEDTLCFDKSYEKEDASEF